ncbi:hypothetical protein ACFLTP_09660 [Chloroflexota bacterium]
MKLTFPPESGIRYMGCQYSISQYGGAPRRKMGLIQLSILTVPPPTTQAKSAGKLGHPWPINRGITATIKRSAAYHA